ncbi:Cyclin-dependent kinase-like 3 [Phytophthora pseudosyringae]|uniref:Cyclin-dependent kinase 2 homolog n=1 Tax=Phytophthora pseudosyringae TaxID=221518 RepID=A0A8T1WFL8_9STRA|nr:Cyclin-dependent kinase-like 3 [Phytophthora pseudosyringae]
MENYESLGTIGEGTYGVVLKCRHKVTGQIVAIKKFKESDDDEQVKKTALREIKILKQLKHENIVSLLEVFRMKGKLYLVFEFVEKTILEEIERHPDGLDPLTLKKLMWQLVRAIHFCHQHNIIHRDIKPENLLVSRNGVLKLCDFGFARPLASAGAKYTEYVSTRWYRAPELLVGDVSYGKAVDVWSIGCMFAEIATGLPLFPGDSDIDQLYHIIRCLGHVTSRQQELFRKNALYVGVKLPHASDLEPLEARFPTLDRASMDFIRHTIIDEPLDRWTCAELLKHPFFENSHDAFEAELQEAIARDLNDTAAVRKKRSRKPSRGSAALASSIPVMPAPILSSAFNDPLANGLMVAANSGVDGAKPLGKPLFAPVAAMQQKKEKGGVAVSDSSSSSNSSSNAHVVPRKTPAGIALGTGIPTGAYHLPTLQGAMNTSSSTSSTTSSTATTTSVSSNISSGGGGDSGSSSSPLFSQNKKLLVPPGAVLPISEQHHAAAPYGQPITTDHMTYVGVHDNVRISMTSHGSRLGGPAGGLTVHPYSTAAPKPPSSYMKNPYGVQQSSSKRGSGKNGGFVVSSLPSSMDMYSPKRAAAGGKSSLNAYGNGTTGWNGSKKGASTGTGIGVSSSIISTRGTPQQGLYVPPRTSHSTIRGATLPQGTFAHVRRDNDPRNF